MTVSEKKSPNEDTLSPRQGGGIDDGELFDYVLPSLVNPNLCRISLNPNLDDEFDLYRLEHSNDPLLRLMNDLEEVSSGLFLERPGGYEKTKKGNASPSSSTTSQPSGLYDIPWELFKPGKSSVTAGSKAIVCPMPFCSSSFNTVDSYESHLSRTHHERIAIAPSNADEGAHGHLQAAHHEYMAIVPSNAGEGARARAC